MDKARKTALQALNKIHMDAGYSNLVLHSLFEKNALDERERAFCSNLVYGVLQRSITLDFIIQNYSKLPLRKIQPQVHNILRLGLQQLLYMDSVPERAAVNESVELCKEIKNTRSAAGFVNGLLRSFIRDGQDIYKRNTNHAPDFLLSIAYSCPQWLVKIWCSAYGEERTKAFLARSVQPPNMFIRVNTLQIAEQDVLNCLHCAGVQAKFVSGIPGCIQLWQSGDIASLPGFEKGNFYVQDLSSQYCCLALDAHDGEIIIDSCSAPGSKAFTLAQYMNGRGQIYAFDLHEKRVNLIRKGAERLNISNILPQMGDASVYNETLPLADKVLCDVPCSGLGVIGRKPEIKYKTQQQLQKLPDIQYKILKNCARYVKLNGILLYSTCSVNPAENEEVVKRFLQETPAFAPLPLPEAFSVLPKTAVIFNEKHQITFFGDSEADGFFISLLTRVR